MSITTDAILNAVCSVLKIDRVTLTSDKRKDITYDYRDAKLLCSCIMREKITFTKVIQGQLVEKTQFGNPRRAKLEVDKPITYKEIGNIFKRKPQAIMASELKCKDLLKTDKDFKAKYEMVIALLPQQNTNP